MERETLVALVGAFVGGVALGATLTRKLKARPDTARYVKIIELQKKAMATSAKLNSYIEEELERRRSAPVVNLPACSDYNIMRTDATAKALRTKLSKEADQILLFGMDNFSTESTLEAQYQVSDLFERWLKIDTMSVDELKSILETVVTLAVIRNVIQSKAKIDTQQMVHIHRWCGLVKEMVFGKSRPHEDRIKLYPAYAERHGKWRDGKLVA